MSQLITDTHASQATTTSLSLQNFIGTNTRVGSAAGIIYWGRIGRAVWKQVSPAVLEFNAKGTILGVPFDSDVKVELLSPTKGRVTIQGLGSKDGDIRVDGNRWIYIDNLRFEQGINCVSFRQEGANTGLSVYRHAWLTGRLDPSRANQLDELSDGPTPDIPSDR